MFENLIKLVGENQEAVAEINKIKGNYEALSSEVTSVETKLADAISKRDKYKSFTKEVKGKLGIEEGEELTAETLDGKITGLLSTKDQTLSDKEKVFKLEMVKMEEAIKDKDTQIGSLSASNSAALLDSRLELELYKTTSGINSVNSKAHDLIIEELKSGATYEEGKIVFKGQDGTTIRDNGVPLTLGSKLESIKSSEDYSFLFKADVKSGSGTQTTGTNTAGSDSQSEFAKKKRAAIAQRRSAINL